MGLQGAAPRVQLRLCRRRACYALPRVPKHPALPAAAAAACFIAAPLVPHRAACAAVMRATPRRVCACASPRRVRSCTAPRRAARVRRTRGAVRHGRVQAGRRQAGKAMLQNLEGACFAMEDFLRETEAHTHTHTHTHTHARTQESARRTSSL